MQRKLEEPAFGERFREDGWDTAYYTPVSVYYDRARKRATINETEFRKVVVTPAAVDESGAPKLFPE